MPDYQASSVYTESDVYFFLLFKSETIFGTYKELGQQTLHRQTIKINVNNIFTILSRFIKVISQTPFLKC